MDGRLMRGFDLNCDMGESFGAWKMGLDAEVIGHITSANIACGFHAGDPMVMDRTVALAAAHGVGVGAHPGFADLKGFGRRGLDCTPEEIRNDILYQVGALRAFCQAHGVALQHVKPHGALSNMAVGNAPLARAIAEAVARVDERLILVTLAGSQAPLMKEIGQEVGLRVALEAFPERGYTAEGRLVSRRLPGAVIKDPAEAAARALAMARDGRITAVDGTVLEMEIHTLCVHGDNPAALAIVAEIRRTLARAGLEARPMGAVF
jgi:UPF0271 protein